MSNQNKIKYDSAYISYVANGDSAAVFIVRDVVRSIDTSGMWIDVISTSGHKNKFDKWDFSSITIELFPRKTKPIYPPNTITEYKKYITWKAANAFRVCFINLSVSLLQGSVFFVWHSPFFIALTDYFVV
ncbi:MAG: hypothetical protein SOW12_08260 [Lachnospiraceae bacterium]|nr:hypothetical protein [Lachnoclostridium sp.]MDY2599906.1 hypothetical protein [Lachnospiraceae bacterium]